MLIRKYLSPMMMSSQCTVLLGTQSALCRWWLWRGVTPGCCGLDWVPRGLVEGWSPGQHSWDMEPVRLMSQLVPRVALLEGGGSWRMWDPLGGGEAIETCLQRRVWSASFASWPQGGQPCFELHYRPQNYRPQSNVITGPWAMQRTGRVSFEQICSIVCW